MNKELVKRTKLMISVREEVFAKSKSIKQKKRETVRS